MRSQGDELLLLRRRELHTKKLSDMETSKESEGGVMDGKRIIRVFPRWTNATPDDPLAAVDRFPGWFDAADEIHISVTFTADLRRSEELAAEWRHVAPVKIGGPALDDKGGEFEPGMYLKHGYVITSRGCPNSCWFCDAWKREGHDVRELDIRDGWNVLDSNLLACSQVHILNVFYMLRNQKHRIEFTGGLEAKRIKHWHCQELRNIRLEQVFFAYDEEADYEPLVEAGKMLIGVGLKRKHPLRAYVLYGYRGDTFANALTRLVRCDDAGFLPQGMLLMNKNGEVNEEWKDFHRTWSRVASIDSELKKMRRVRV